MDLLLVLLLLGKYIKNLFGGRPFNSLVLVRLKTILKTRLISLKPFKGSEII